MPVDLIVEGSDEIARVAKALKAAGATELRRDLYRGIQRATKPLKQDVKQAAVDKLPKRGGLNQWVAKSKLATRTRGGGNQPGVRITAAKGDSDLRSIDRGRLRHPVFGNRKVWVTQSVTPGWFTETLDKGADPVRREILGVLEDVAGRISRA